MGFLEREEKYKTVIYIKDTGQFVEASGSHLQPVETKPRVTPPSAPPVEPPWQPTVNPPQGSPYGN